ncbi:MAG: hypothetical protein ABS95_01080 [Verrucomicrobia bacterium SCN 57-15]|nr:MAG: hypothetical protein ABS95_01080 [Verrucomicrobia bacterium SCN 57-15]
MNEITVVAKLTITNDGTGQTDYGDVTKNLTPSTVGQKYSSGQTVTTTAADIDLGGLITFSTVGIIWIKNNSTTTGEDVLLQKSSVVFSRIKPQEAYVMRVEPDGVAWQVKSATGSPQIRVVATGATS